MVQGAREQQLEVLRNPRQLTFSWDKEPADCINSELSSLCSCPLLFFLFEWTFHHIDCREVFFFCFHCLFPLEYGLSLSHLLMPYILWVILITFFLNPAFYFSSPLASFLTYFQREMHTQLVEVNVDLFDRCFPSKEPCVYACRETLWKLNRNEARGIWNNPSELFLAMFSHCGAPTSSGLE